MKNYSATSEIVDRVIDRRVGPCRLIVLPFGADGVVTVAGSIASYPDIRAGEDQIQDLVNAMLDKGTRFRDQFEIAAYLEEAGAERSYYGGVARSRFGGRCLSGAIGKLMSVISEEVRYPSFEGRQFELLKTRSQARIRQSLQRTAMLASDALSRHWFDMGHPNYERGISTELELLGDTTVESVRSLHATHFGSDDLTLVVVGDVRLNALEQLVGEYFGDWLAVETAPTFETESRTRRRTAGEYVYVHDKPSIDVAIGHSVPMTRRDDAFLPLLVGNFVLGGNFSSRLMQTIRDEMGLTYGIRSALSGVSVYHDMLWKIAVTLGQSTVDSGIEAILSLVKDLVSRGITDRELARAKETIIGSYLVRQDTSGNLAQTMLVNAERGYPIRQLSDYPGQIRQITRKQVNEALARFIEPSAVSVAAAGTVAKRPRSRRRAARTDKRKVSLV